MPPELAVKVTGTPDSRLFDASRTIAEIVAEVEPSDGMVLVLVFIVTTATLAIVPGVPPPLELELELELDPDPGLDSVLPPPHAASSALNSKPNISFFIINPSLLSGACLASASRKPTQ